MRKGVSVGPLGPCLPVQPTRDHSDTEMHLTKLVGGRCNSGCSGLLGKLEKPQLELEKVVQGSYVDLIPFPNQAGF